MNTEHHLTLCIAGLEIKFDTRDSDLDLAVPFIYKKFLKENLIKCPILDSGKGSLSLKVHNDQDFFVKRWGMPLCLTEIWELWVDENDCFVFVSPKQSPPKRVTIDPDFKFGEIAGDFSSVKDKSIYPLSSIDIRIVVNWLACFGDLILHAAGVAVNNQGYCFVGKAGTGKSTLVSALSKDKFVEVLGEDQVILRYFDGKFWIFGTPWHEHVEMCSPIGVPLKKLFFLDREREQGIQPFPVSAGIIGLLQTGFIPYYLPEKINLIMDRLSILGKEIPFYSLSYRLGSEILSLICE